LTPHHIKERDTMDYLVRFAHVHETFRQPELEALAVLADMKLNVLHYSTTVGHIVPRRD